MRTAGRSNPLHWHAPPHYCRYTSHSRPRQHSPEPRRPPTRGPPPESRSSHDRPLARHRHNRGTPIERHLTCGNPMHDRPKHGNQPIQRPIDPPKRHQPIPAVHRIASAHKLAYGATQRTQTRIGGNGDTGVHPPVNTTPAGWTEVKTPSFTLHDALLTVNQQRRAGRDQRDFDLRPKAEAAFCLERKNQRTFIHFGPVAATAPTPTRRRRTATATSAVPSAL
jgi:hypothetical protein